MDGWICYCLLLVSPEKATQKRMGLVESVTQLGCQRKCAQENTTLDFRPERLGPSIGIEHSVIIYFTGQSSRS
jgi:hypothetical protein